MSNENIVILKMLDQGKISVDDTIKLLNTVNSINLSEPKVSSSIESNINKFSNALDNLTKDIKIKVQKDVPKIKENTHSILSKTGEIFSDFGKNVKDIFTSDSNTTEVEEIKIEDKDTSEV